MENQATVANFPKCQDSTDTASCDQLTDDCLFCAIVFLVIDIILVIAILGYVVYHLAT